MMVTWDERQQDRMISGLYTDVMQTNDVGDRLHLSFVVVNMKQM